MGGEEALRVSQKRVLEELRSASSRRRAVWSWKLQWLMRLAHPRALM